VGPGAAHLWADHLAQRARAARGRLRAGELPGVPSLADGVEARIIAWWASGSPPGAHKVGAAFGCLVPRLVTGQFDPTTQKAVWPSTGNYCRAGPSTPTSWPATRWPSSPRDERERFEWLQQVAARSSPPRSESNVKEIFDKCWELRRSGEDVVIFNQFDEFGNYLWHYAVTGPAIEEVLQRALRPATATPGGVGHRLGGHHRLWGLAEAAPPLVSKITVSEALGSARPCCGPASAPPHRGHRRQARPLDPQRAQHRPGGGHRRRRP